MTKPSDLLSPLPTKGQTEKERQLVINIQNNIIRCSFCINRAFHIDKNKIRYCNHHLEKRT